LFRPCRVAWATMRSLATAVSEILRGIAAKHGVSPVELARRTGHRKDKIHRLFAGRTVLNIDDADIICRALGIDLSAVVIEATAETPDRPSRISTAEERLGRM
jgi:ribosome-binding protein aMBF1 (putative translation factor)